MRIIVLTILYLLLTGCSNPKIDITAEYIVNENWSKKKEQAGANSITINKMKVKNDSVINLSFGLTQQQILDKLEEDSSFMHYSNVRIRQEEEYENKKIYFDRDNGFYWGSKSRYNNDSTRTIGNLQKNSWYKFSHLVPYPYYVYIYVDSTNKVYRFDVNLANY